MSFVVLPIGPGSDGDSSKWPTHNPQLSRNDEYYLEKIATEKWIKDLDGGPQPGVVYRLDRLPDGYAGFERGRPGTKHIDRYMYGHPNGIFRSLNEIYPHFKHLMDNGGPAGCTCKLCSGGSAARRGGPGAAPRAVRPSDPSKVGKRPNTGGEGTSSPQKRKHADVEGTTDIYESLMKQLKRAGPDESLDIALAERNSPDWWTGFASAQATIKAIQKQPRYVPRRGEIVLFPRSTPNDEEHTIAWDPTGQTFRMADLSAKAWLAQPEWQAGVVTQVPDEPVSDQDLLDDSEQTRSVNYSGFRIEPLSEPGNDHKIWTKQSKYVPLHRIRPFSMLQECINGTSASDWHPTIEHARRVTSSFCVVGRYRFKGTWPNATVFATGVYLGPELIIVGDAVRLLPRSREQKANTVTDVMVITAIRLRFVNMHQEEDEAWPPSIPYQTCLHFSGRVYTLDPKRSFDGVGKQPISPNSDDLPAGLSGYGTWYHYTDPHGFNTKIEVPYTRVLGRCGDTAAIDAWFTAPSDIEPTVSFRAINAGTAATRPDHVELSRGLAALVDARAYSQQTDKRLKEQGGRQWYWADTRIEQLDLHEVNDRFVGKRHELRTNESVAAWRGVLRNLTANQPGSSPARATPTKTLGGAMSLGSENVSQRRMQSTVEEDENETFALAEEQHEDHDAMEIDRSERSNGGDVDMSTPGRKAAPAATGVINLDQSDSEDEEDRAANQLADELAKQFRTGGSARVSKAA